MPDPAIEPPSDCRNLNLTSVRAYDYGVARALPPHGTRARYLSRAAPCRNPTCPANPTCTEAHRRYHVAYRAKWDPPKHGQLAIPSSAYETIRAGR